MVEKWVIMDPSTKHIWRNKVYKYPELAKADYYEYTSKDLEEQGIWELVKVKITVEL